MAHRERKILYDFTHMWNIKNKKKQISKENKTKANSYTQRTD